MKESLCKLTVLLLLALFPSSLLAGEVLYYHTDNFGTPMAMTDKTGKVVWRADELPFGEQYQTEEDPVRNNVRFLGKRYDPESGLICMGKRYLDPRTGRFTQPDPVGLVDPATGKVNQEMLLNPQRLNRYVYALNNPYRYVDPEGDFAIVGAALIGAAIAYFSHPDVANAPKSASSPTYESHGARTIALGAIGGAGLRGVGGILAARKISQVVSRRTRSGETAVRITRRNGSVIDISPKRVKEYRPNSHPNAPEGTLDKVKFEKSIPGSKGYKRFPTNRDLKILKKYK